MPIYLDSCANVDDLFSHTIILVSLNQRF